MPSDFTYDAGTNVATKYDLVGIPTGADPSRYLDASDCNIWTDALDSLRSAITGGRYIALASSPSEAVSDSGAIKIRSNAGLLEVSENGAAYGNVLSELAGVVALRATAGNTIKSYTANSGSNVGLTWDTNVALNGNTIPYHWRNAGTLCMQLNKTELSVWGAASTDDSITRQQMAVVENVTAYNASPETGYTFYVLTNATDILHIGGVQMGKSNATINNGDSFMRFLTRSNSPNQFNEVMRLTATARVLVGTTTDDGSHMLQVSGSIVGSNLSGTNTGDLTLASVGSSPAAAGASISSQVLTLQPADATHPGVMSAAHYTLVAGATNSNTASTIVKRDGSGNFSAGALTLGTALTIGNGGTGQTTRAAALGALLPSDSGSGGYFLTTDGSGVFTWAAVSSGTTLPADAAGFLKDNGSGTLTWASPAFTDITGTATAAQLPNPSASTLGGVQSKASASHQFLTQISTSGVVSAAQPAATDLSDWPANSSGVLTNNGSGTLTWAAAAGSGVTTMAAVGSSPNANGASISSVTLTLQPASASFPGVLTAAHYSLLAGAASLATASTLALRDANGNAQFTNSVQGYATTATAAATTTLTVASTYEQRFTGSTTQTVKLPDCTTLATGVSYLIVNLSSGVVTVQDSAAGALCTIQGAGNTAVEFVCTNIATAAGAWDILTMPSLDSSGNLVLGSSSVLLKNTAGNTLKSYTANSSTNVAWTMDTNVAMTGSTTLFQMKNHGTLAMQLNLAELSIWGAAATDSIIHSQFAAVENSTAFNASPETGFSFYVNVNATPDILHIGAIQMGKNNTTSGNQDSFMRFITRSASPNQFNEVMRLTPTANLLVGGTSDTAAAEKLQVTGAGAVTTTMKIGTTGLIGTSLSVGTTSTPPQGVVWVQKSTSGGLGGDIWVCNSASSALSSECAISWGSDGTTDATPNARMSSIVTNAGSFLADLVVKLYDGSALNEKWRFTSGSGGSVGHLYSQEGAKLGLNGSGLTSYVQSSATTHGMVYFSNVTAASSNTAHLFDTTNTLSGSDLLADFQNHTTSKFSISNGGATTTAGIATSAGATNTGARIESKRTTVADADKTVATTDHTIAYTSIAAARAVTLPTATLGLEIVVLDESGSCSLTNTITIATVQGGSVVLNTAYGFARFWANGTNWYRVG